MPSSKEWDQPPAGSSLGVSLNFQASFMLFFSGPQPTTMHDNGGQGLAPLEGPSHGGGTQA